MTEAERTMTRRLALLGGLTLMLGACGGRRDVPLAQFQPLDFDYLTKLRLNVARIDIDDSWTPSPGPRQVGYLSPTSPLDALRLMAQQRLLPVGSSGHGTFVIEDASIVIVNGRYSGNLAVRLNVASDQQQSGYAEARVSRTADVDDDQPNAMRASIDALVRQMMGDMNVEFEYQIRRSLRDYLQSDDTTAPIPAQVQSQDLGPAGARGTAPTPLQPSSAAPPYSAPAASYPAPGYPAPGYSSTPNYAPPAMPYPSGLPPGTQPLRLPTPLSP